MIVLAIDYGSRHLGFAWASTPLASPLRSVTVSSPNEAIAATLKQLSAINPSLIVLGCPDGDSGDAARAYSTLLRQATSIPVVLHPETLSTHEAKLRLRAAHASQAKRRDDHTYAACLILEDYLELNPDLVKI